MLNTCESSAQFPAPSLNSPLFPRSPLLVRGLPAPRSVLQPRILREKAATSYSRYHRGLGLLHVHLQFTVDGRHPVQDYVRQFICLMWRGFNPTSLDGLTAPCGVYGMVEGGSLKGTTQLSVHLSRPPLLLGLVSLYVRSRYSPQQATSQYVLCTFGTRVLNDAR